MDWSHKFVICDTGNDTVGPIGTHNLNSIWHAVQKTVDTHNHKQEAINIFIVNTPEKK